MATNTTYPEQVAFNVEAAFRSAGESVKSVAEGAGIPRVTLIRRLTGSTPFTVAEIAQIARYLGTTPAELLAGAVA